MAQIKMDKSFISNCNVYRQYEREKQRLLMECKTTEEYETKIQEVIKRLKL